MKAWRWEENPDGCTHFFCAVPDTELRAAVKALLAEAREATSSAPPTARRAIAELHRAHAFALELHESWIYASAQEGDAAANITAHLGALLVDFCTKMAESIKAGGGAAARTVETLEWMREASGHGEPGGG